MGHLIYHAGTDGKANNGNARGMLQHTQRRKEDSHNHKNEDIDPDKTKYNLDFMHSKYNKRGMNAYEVLQERLENDYQGKRKLRKDQVVIREIITQPSPEMFEGMNMEEKRDTMKKFVKDSIPWFNKEFGEDNVLGMSAHLDETNPHAHVITMPMTDDGRISQTEFFTGPKALQQQHKDYRLHMIDKGWDFEEDNKYEKIDNHKMPVFKANAKQIQGGREQQTEDIRNLSQDTDIRQEAVNLAYEDVHENVLKEEREKLERERKEMEELAEKNKKELNDIEINSNALLNKERQELHNQKMAFMSQVTDTARGYARDKTIKAMDEFIADDLYSDNPKLYKSVINESVQGALRQGNAKGLQEQSKEIKEQVQDDDELEL